MVTTTAEVCGEDVGLKIDWGKKMITCYKANKEKDLNFLSAIKDMVGTLKEKHDPIVVERVLRMLDSWEEEIKIKDAL